ncbi:MBL fold metallo-hydrolase [Desulfovibrio ferrophilus]|uniref:Beta-lactamase domain protein n=1 Tax=Desulfovibrio ferrophilus TaxID=241368 RepID=A0A2Z6AUH8_9BACT|nr:MBL fold metallo-hydrolase [Desulfovibrio ferrophilus]BBD06883.1 beta-lactamase domain protein [Desulfovibrio ferrophilus]
MFIRCWGSRGSIPVSGPEYNRFGGDTTCIEIRNDDDDIVVVDAGSGIRRLGNLLLKEGRFDLTMLFTHAHWDHVLGLPFFKPVYMPQTTLQIHGCPFEMGDLFKVLQQVMNAPYFPVQYGELLSTRNHSLACDLEIMVGGMSINSIPLSHPNKGQGFKFEEKGKSFVFLTDNELDFEHPGGTTYEDYLAFSKGADLLVHDAEYLPTEYEKLTRGWGHTTYTRALELAIEAKVRAFGLFHLNQDRTDEQVDAMVEDCRRIAAQRGVDMEIFAMAQDQEITL